ncbi:diguanylate cyclase domain-containing protein [Actinoplanes sp. NPDC048988]|uniref:diguanylate cyclase domain-containing protein n=1 Tax=Actinoplanes sp. NPDC048988 TaxID=3363901 RepID=UPI0037219F67
MVLRWYVAFAGAMVAGYLLWPYELRQWPFLLVTLATLPAVGAALRRAPRGERSPWWLQLAALALFNVGNLWWIWLVIVRGRETGDGSAAGLLFSVANVVVLAGALVVVVKRGRGDAGGVIDSVITAVALSGVLWDVVLLPALTVDGVSASGKISAFVNLIVLTGALGALIRLSSVGAGQITAVRLLTAGIGLTLIGNVAGTLAVDASGLRADWTNMVFLAAYMALGCAALHPSAAVVTAAGPAPDDHLSVARLTFLGVMLAIGPVIGGGRVLLSQPADGVLLAVSSAALIPLVMVRVGRLSEARRSAERALRRLATSDALTGLPNRAAWIEHVTAELADRPAELTVLFCDLDGFKAVNDRLGHAAGDELLVGVANRLRGCVREDDLIGRFGGDEFVIVCRGAGAVDVISDRIRAMVAEPFPAGAEPAWIGVSMGVAQARAGDSTDDVVARADLAMYEAKRAKTIGALSLAVA